MSWKLWGLLIEYFEMTKRAWLNNIFINLCMVQNREKIKLREPNFEEFDVTWRNEIILQSRQPWNCLFDKPIFNLKLDRFALFSNYLWRSSSSLLPFSRSQSMQARLGLHPGQLMSALQLPMCYGALMIRNMTRIAHQISNTSDHQIQNFAELEKMEKGSISCMSAKYAVMIQLSTTLMFLARMFPLKWLCAGSLALRLVQKIAPKLCILGLLTQPIAVLHLKATKKISHANVKPVQTQE